MKNYIGKNVLIFCVNYIYTGKLEKVNKFEVVLSNAAIVYETGSFDSKKFTDAQIIGAILTIRMSAIESYSLTEKI